MTPQTKKNKNETRKQPIKLMILGLYHYFCSCGFLKVKIIQSLNGTVPFLVGTMRLQQLAVLTKSCFFETKKTKEF